jgi:glycosyltransferase involved in cell wall biosynthesis
MKISIITATYNSERYVTNCLQSVAWQSYKNIEHIIIDGGSTDKTLDIVKSFPSVAKYISEPDKGIYDAMNKGIKLASGDIIGILNSDDLYVDNTVIESIVNVFKSKNVDCVHADLFYVDQNDTKKVIRHWKSSEYMRGAFQNGWHPAHPTFFVKKDIYEKYGLFNLDLQLAADFELMLRFIDNHKISSLHIQKPIVRMRLGGATSKNLKNIIKQNIECYKAFKINGLPVSPLYTLFRILPKLKQFFHA